MWLVALSRVIASCSWGPPTCLKQHTRSAITCFPSRYWLNWLAGRRTLKRGGVYGKIALQPSRESRGSRSRRRTPFFGDSTTQGSRSSQLIRMRPRSRACAAIPTWPLSRVHSMASWSPRIREMLSISYGSAVSATCAACGSTGPSVTAASAMMRSGNAKRAVFSASWAAVP